jgi:hypothetical protein
MLSEILLLLFFIKVEATDDDCANQDHRVCGYEITTPNAPFSIDSNGVISLTKPLNNGQYEFDVIAIDCYPAEDNSRKVSQPARVTFKIIKSCKPMITGISKKLTLFFIFIFIYLDKSDSKLIVQTDSVHPFDTINIDTCDETCNVEDIVGTVQLDTKGLDNGCDLKQCCMYLIKIK